MRKNSIVLKLGITIFIILLSVLLPLILMIDQLFSRSFYKEAHLKLDHFAAEYAAAVSKHDHLHSLQTISNLTETEMFVINPTGKILITSNTELFKQGSYMSKELVEAVNIKKAGHIEYQPTANHPTYFVSGKNLLISNQTASGLIVFSNAEKIKNSVRHIELLVLVSLLGALCMALIFTYIASRKFASPLLQMEAVTRAVAKGEFYPKVTISSNDELGSLGSAINDLGQEIERYRNRQREFFANISHDLRTPISYIKGYTRVVRDKLYKNDKEKELYLSIINDEVDQLNVLIRDLFELSKIEGGHFELHFNWINIHELIENCLIKASLKAKQQGIHLCKKIDDNIPMIYTDGTRLEQIIMNLVENAIRYNRKHGTIKLKAWADKKKVHLAIEDTGVGIPEDDLPFIFERFYKVDKSRSNRLGSTGLGLSIVKHLVVLLKGEIKVKSKLEKGTIFHITLPFKK
ncbi:cell wall metabolism sensor histidine kinase WalK [Bacillus sp. V5-8f]|uniref:sensor histidine kinase n=1 Tax=Bacillus sp. V5-8f TaxID=2053044 RepID=UPI000C77806D|nr:HAMP domain-containing sensor histidine kinase [Bacillus sp. V5-8f]PLT32500.1 hypothetical protein CUU64_18500 [Bacillus sp. V5-8f]